MHACMHIHVAVWLWSCLNTKCTLVFIQRYKYAVIIKHCTLGSVNYFIIRYTNNIRVYVIVVPYGYQGCIGFVLPRAVVCIPQGRSPREYIQLHEVVQ